MFAESATNYDLQSIISAANRTITTQVERQKQQQDLLDTLLKLQSEIKELCTVRDLYFRAATILSDVTDDMTQATLDNITGVINKALAVLFTSNPRWVKIEKSLYRKLYNHFNVELHVEDGSVRSFEQSGSGLAQTISFLFTLCLIDARGGRKILVMDELLNGLHPEAKSVCAELMLSLTSRFQFVAVEYGLDIGKQYLFQNTNGKAQAIELPETNYYASLILNRYKAKEVKESV